jgi:prophage tail gpP-like protein
MPVDGNISVLAMEFDDTTPISVWESVSISDSFTDPIGQVDLQVRPTRADISEYADKFKRGRQVTLKINRAPQGTYLIDTVMRTIDAGGVSYKLTLKSMLVTAYEGSVDPEISKSFKSDTPVSQVVLEALDPYGFTQITVDTARDVGAISGKPIPGRKSSITASALKIKDAQAQENETAYAFCQRMFNRLGVALRCDHTGELLLSAPDYDQEIIGQLIHEMVRARQGDRMLDGIQITETNAGQFSEFCVRGKAPSSKKGQRRSGRPAARLGVASLAASRPSSAPFGSVPFVALAESRAQYASDAAPYKPKFALDKFSRDVNRCQSVAKLVYGLKASKGFVVKCSVDGWVSGSTGRVWAVDTMAHVVVEAVGLEEDMWISERVLTESDAGQLTTLTLIPKYSLLLGEIPKS